MPILAKLPVLMAKVEVIVSIDTKLDASGVEFHDIVGVKQAAGNYYRE